MRETDLESLLRQVLVKEDMQAFDCLFHSCYFDLVRHAQKILRETAAAEEVVSEVFLRIWKNRKNLHVHTSAKSYLYTSVRNRAIDYLRRHYQANQRVSSLETRHYQLAGDTKADQRLAYEELSERVETAISMLPPRCGLIFRLSRDQGMSYKDIANMLDISHKTVETQMGRALKKLRQILDK